MRAFCIISSAALLAWGPAGCGDDGGNGAHQNTSPQAILIGPVEIGAGAMAHFDASGSTDADGIVVAYRFNFGDGSPAHRTGQAAVGHTYAEAGSYQVALDVEDDHAASDRITLRLRVIENPAVPACSPEQPCPAGTACMCLDDGDCPGGSCEQNHCPDGTGVCYQQLGG